MASGRVIFEGFSLDLGDRRLSRGVESVELNSRFLDALALLVAEHGRLVPKDRFMEQVWQGVPVTDEALTQCIRTLRRVLGDEAARPRFIETVPKHGYRFVATVEPGDAGSDPAPLWQPFDWRSVLQTGGAAGLGGALAGACGGVFYGLGAAPYPANSGMGGVSILLVLIALGALLGLAGGAGVGAGIAVGQFAPSPKWQWSAAGGMFGGIAVGALARLLGLDAFELLFGHAPAQMTGAPEGSLLGVALGAAVWVARTHRLTFARSAATGAVAGGMAGLLIPVLGGHLLGGSLNSLTANFAGARFRLDGIGRLFGEASFGRLTELGTATLEGALFGLCVAGALARTRNRSA